MKPSLITTAIDYVNGAPHLGHAVEKIQADVLARHYRRRGNSVIFLTGTDENSLKNVKAAQQAGQDIQSYVDQNAELFRNLKEQLDLSFDIFIRTTEDRHMRGAQKLWQAFKPNDVYQKTYRGLYCVGCEEFKLEKDLMDGKCPEHQIEPEIVEEENYFFRLSSYQTQLEQLIAEDTIRITPEHRKNEMLAFIRGGLDDLSISRSRERAQGWGVPVPGDPKQIMYVWVDALSNYITALDYADGGEKYQTFWAGESERIHVIGKGIVRFHAIYWPAFLLSAGLPLPTQIVAHEYFTINGQKISKSLGNAIDPAELVSRYGRAATRYLLLSSLSANHDGDISFDKLDERYSADLANSLGNLLQRTLVLRNKFGVTVSAGAAPSCAAADQLTERYRYDEALAEIWKLVAHANHQLETEAPWQERDEAQRTHTLTSITRQLETIAASLDAYLPETSRAIFSQLTSGEPKPLFPRLG